MGLIDRFRAAALSRRGYCTACRGDMLDGPAVKNGRGRFCSPQCDDENWQAHQW